ncbi:class I SAM-dependent methyltransferase [Flavitalea sp. BT771]|uniref:class I SAM-dependent methyltransferase n=1 Tax=Flavitalea sp. BT771 TaxID=3063329 RepID=UPI0026E34908|nr:class I SAM-dependent methyltransferase [Flavitalea sp. BT771]MDO6433207.1 class I SAM-dependent methyltransferase [Flavitalea sp. BT771]MDV6221517.1 class I SAM-dependent methyltransferase [Flavitalea sp. BT771]
MKEGLLGKILSKIPYIRYAYYYRRYSLHRPGHYYSPVINLDEIASRKAQIWNSKKELPGINLNDAEQETFIQPLSDAAALIPFKSQPNQTSHRYYFDNKTYAHADGLVLFSILMHFRPKRVIEVGSGFSSSLMLDTNDTLLNNSIHFTFIEPNPDMTLNSLLRKEDYQNTDVKVNLVQDVDPQIFSTLKENDILLIDNSHVSKTGSDVNYLMTEVLPRLNKGVLIHIHDIFYPFEYPQDWVFEHRLNWNEIYVVHNFLLFNNAFEIVFFSDYMQQKMKATYADKIPLFFKDRPGSIWLRKVV